MTALDPATHDRAVAAISHLPAPRGRRAGRRRGAARPELSRPRRARLQGHHAHRRGGPAHVARDLPGEPRGARARRSAAFRAALDHLDRLVASGDAPAIEASSTGSARAGWPAVKIAASTARCERLERTAAERRCHVRGRDAHELVITIDGPAGAGKWPGARAGAAPRLPAARHRRDVPRARVGGARGRRRPGEDPSALAAVLDRTRVELDGDRVLVDGTRRDGRDPDARDRRLTSQLTTLAPVRDKMTPLQRELAVAGGVVLEGRDTGTVVWPDAEVKFYLDASLETRARRRQRGARRAGRRRGRRRPCEPTSPRATARTASAALAPLRKPRRTPRSWTRRGSRSRRSWTGMLQVVERARCCTGS